MSFLINQFAPVGSQTRRGEAPQKYTYKNMGDSISDMSGDNYFSEVSFQLVPDDTIDCVTSDGMIIYQVVSSDPVSKNVVVKSNIPYVHPIQKPTFVDIYSVDDFKKDFEGNFILENGIIYQVYIEGTVTTDKYFIFDDDYSNGGELAFMGPEGLLEWNTSAEYFIYGDYLGTKGPVFSLKNFNITTTSTEESLGLRMGDPFIDKLVISNVGLFGFVTAAILNSGIHVLRINNVNVATTDTGHHSVDDFFKVAGTDIIMENSKIESPGSEHGALEIKTNSLNKAYISNCQLVVPATTSPGLRITPGNAPSDYILFSNCSLLTANGAQVANPFNVDQKIIKAITQTSATVINIETYAAHGLVTADEFQLWGTLNYNSTLEAVNSVIDSTHFTVVKDFVGINTGGAFNTIESFTTHSSTKIKALNCIGIPSPKARGFLYFSGNTAEKTYTNNTTKQPIPVNSGKSQPSRTVFPKDFAISSHNEVSIKYTGESVIDCFLQISFMLTSTGSSSTKEEFSMELQDVEFLFEDRGNLMPYTAVFPLHLDPGDLIYPQIRKTAGSDDIDLVVENLYAMVHTS